MSVLVVGSVAIDDVETPFGRGTNVLGGSASYFSLAASRFAPVRVVAVIGEDFPAAYLDRLRAHDVEIVGVKRVPGESFFWSGSYGRELKQATTRETRLGVFADFSPELSAEERSARFVFLANIDPALQSRVLDQLEAPSLVVLDTMNYWIQNHRAALDAVLPRVHYVVVNDEELELLTGESNLLLGARRLLDLGLRGVVVKKGAHGAFLETPDDYFALPAFPTDAVVDPTGAGDSFAGGFVGTLAGTDAPTSRDVRRAVAHGVVTASFTVEAFSVERLERITTAEFDDRLRRLRAFCCFD